MLNSRPMSGAAICTPARAFSAIALLMFAVLGAGCAGMIPRDVVPERLADEAELTGMPNVRVWGDASAESVAALVKAERPRNGGACRSSQTFRAAITGGQHRRYLGWRRERRVRSRSPGRME